MLPYVDSEAEIHPGVTACASSTSRLTWNASIFYEKGPIEVRLAADYVGQDLFALRRTAAGDAGYLFGSRLTMDIGASYQVSRIVIRVRRGQEPAEYAARVHRGHEPIPADPARFYDFHFLAGLRADF